jgi:hypothetical protein
MNKKLIALAGIGTLAVTLTACGGGQPSSQEDQVAQKASKSKAYIPQNDVELRNYNKAQELYDDPAAIQWCTAFPSSNSAPIITVPIAGKLTTSATSYFSPTKMEGDTSGGYINTPNRSVDGLFHGDSFYRYGFTPAGVYVDFSNSLELLCQTSLTEYQRQHTFVDGANAEGDVDARQAKAEEALKAGDGDKAAKILKGN